MAASLYEALDVEKNQIRMLSIRPGSSESVLKCAMTTETLINPIKFDALSYCWGDANITTGIFLNGLETQVTKNLADALLQLRAIGVHRVWADAICINQADRREQTHQLRVMRVIYERAATTFAWIGRDGSDRAASAIRFLQTLADSRGYWVARDIFGVNHTATCPRENPHTKHPSTSEDCDRCIRDSQFEALQGLFNREYWKRRWIIQELAVASQAQIVCGNSRISLNDFDMALQLSKVQQKLTNYQYYKAIADFRTSLNEKQNISLCKAIASTYMSLSQDPRDKVYAVRGLCTDGEELVPAPSYELSEEAVASSLTKAFIWKHRSLDFMLLDLQKKKSQSSIPSWAADWLHIERFASEACDLTTRQSNIDRTFLPKPPLEDLEMSTLQVQGVFIGRIAKLGCPFTTEHQSSFTTIEGSSKSGNVVDPVRQYYGVVEDILSALLSSIAPEIDFAHNIWPAWHALAWYSQKPEDVPFLQQWIKTNEHIDIEGKAFSTYFMEKCQSLSRTSESRFRSGFRFWLKLVAYVCGVWVGPTTGLFVAGNHSGIFTLRGIGILWFFFGLILFPCVLSEFQVAEEQIRVNRESVQKFHQPVRSALKITVESGLRLFLSDKGFIGMAHPHSNVGDEICFLVGCSSPLFLREVRTADRVQHCIIGTARFSLSPSDKDCYREFSRGDDIPLLLEKNRRKGKYREIELI